MRYLVEPLPAAGSGSQRQREHDLAVGLLARLVGQPVAVAHRSSGAPYLPEHPHLHISISHCRRAVAAAVSDCGAVGIDIECRRHITPALMERTCSTDELDAIRQSPDQTMAFLRLWTRKEAILKCRGTGIQGFGSLTNAAEAADIAVSDLPCGLPDVVASLAHITDG